MSDYSKTVDFAAKDALPTGYPGKVALGTQVDTEFNNIQIAVATKADVPAAPIVNEIPVTTAGGDLTNSGLFATGGEILDANGNELLEFGTTASAVATLKVTNAATGNPPILSVSSSVAGADIGMTLSDTNGNELLKLSSVDSAINEITITNAAAGNKPSINQTGSGDVGLDIEGIEIKNGVIPTATITTLTSTTATIAGAVIQPSVTTGTGTYIVNHATGLDKSYRRGHTGTSFTKVYEYTAPVSGSFDVQVSLISQNAVSTAHSRVYVNGVAAGADHSTTTGTLTCNDTITVVADDLIQIYTYASGGGSGWNVYADDVMFKSDQAIKFQFCATYGYE